MRRLLALAAFYAAASLFRYGGNASSTGSTSSGGLDQYGRPLQPDRTDAPATTIRTSGPISGFDSSVEAAYEALTVTAANTGASDSSGTVLDSTPAETTVVESSDGADSTFTADDEAAVWYYTTEAYRKLNGYLRNPDAFSAADQASLQASADQVSVGLSHLPNFEGQTYRGVDFSALPPSVAEQYQPGSVVTEAAFTSTTTDVGVATGGFNGDTLMIIEGQSGTDVAPYSQYPDESEILYDKGTDFLVTDRVYDPTIGKTVIRLTEVPRD
jgi:hypothetical protein